VALGCGQERELVQLAVRVLRVADQQAAQVAHHALDGRWVEARLVVREAQQHLAIRDRDNGNGVVGMRGAAHVGDLQRAAACAAGSDRAQRQVLEDQDALEQRQAARDLGPALDFDQRGVFVLAQLGLLGLQFTQPGQEFCCGRHMDTHRQGVDEQPHHALGPRQVCGPS